MRKLRKLVEAVAFPAAVLAGHLVASRVLGLYALYPRLDVPFHFLGGLSIGYTTARIVSCLRAENLIAPVEKPILLGLILTTTAAATVAWELLEFALDQTLGTNVQISLPNAMQDQFVGLLGGLLMLAVRAVAREP
jgi:hypothetical protein